MPTSRQIARIKAKLDQFLTETAVIERLVDGTDAAGVPLDGWQMVAEDVPCRVIDANSRVSNAWQMVAQTDAMVDMVRIVFTSGTDVDADYRATIGDRVYQVVEITDDRTDAVDVIVHAKRIRGHDGRV